MTFYWPSILGFLLGFGFGVGCALAVMYSIYLGGYRAAVRTRSFLLFQSATARLWQNWLPCQRTRGSAW